MTKDMDKTERLKKLYEIVNENRPSTAEVASLLSSLIKSVKEALDKTRSDLESSYKGVANELKVSQKATLSPIIDEAIKSLESSLMALISKSSKETQDKAYKQLNAALLDLEQQIRSIDKYDDTAIHAQWSAVIDSLQTDMDKVKLLIPTATDIRDSLETLKDDERLDVSAIKGINKINKDIEEAILMRATGILDSRTSFLINKVSALQAQVNAAVPIVTTTGYQQPTSGAVGQGVFTWAVAPNVIVVDGRTLQRVQTDSTENWTIAGTTITLIQWPQFDIFAIN